MNKATIEEMHLKVTLEVIKGKLQSHNYFVTLEKELPGAHQLRLSTGSIVNISAKGKIALQGKNDGDLKDILGFLRG